MFPNYAANTPLFTLLVSSDKVRHKMRDNMHLLHYAGEQYIGLYEDIPILGHGFRETRRHSHNLWYMYTSISSFRMTMTDEKCTDSSTSS